MIKILQRIKKAYDLETDAEVAKFLEIKPSTLSMQKNRGRLNLKRILDKCSDLNRNWLLDGEGPIKKSELRAADIPVYSSLKVAETGELNFQESKKEGKVLLDVTEELCQLSPIPRGQMIGYVVSEDGMAPTLRSNDIAVVDLESRAPKEEAVFLISSEDATFCRRIEENTQDYYIIDADNPSKKPFELSKNGNETRILGEMVWVMRRL